MLAVFRSKKESAVRRRAPVALLLALFLLVASTTVGLPPRQGIPEAKGSDERVDQTSWWLESVLGATSVTRPQVGRLTPRLAIVAPGIDPDHPALDGLAITDAKSFGPALDSTGTAVAGVAAAKGPAGSFEGVWPGMKLLHSTAVEGDCDSAAAAVRRAATGNRGVGVILMAYDFPAGACQAHLAATQFATRQGMVLVAPVGDLDGVGPVPSPAGAPHVLGVGAVDVEDLRAPFSATGPTVDLVAPGASVLVPTIRSLDGEASREFGEQDGTVYSSAMVAAAAAWIVQARPELRPSQVVRILTQTASGLGAAGWDDEYGFGRVSIAGALARQTPPPADRMEPNDDIGWINGRLLRSGGRPLRADPVWTGQRRGSREVTATLFRRDDIADVYRIRLARKSRILIRVAQPVGDVAIELRSPSATTITEGRGVIARSDVAEPDTEGLVIRNPGRSARSFYLAITRSKGQLTGDLTRYRMTIANYSGSR